MPYREGLSGQHSAGGYAGEEAGLVYGLQKDACRFFLFYEILYMVLAVYLIKRLRVVFCKLINEALDDIYRKPSV